MKRVFHIVTHFDLGGAETVAVNIAKSAHPGFEYHLVEVVRGRGQFSDEFVRHLEDWGIRYHRSLVSNKKLGITLFPFWFIFLFLRYRPTIIHSHTEVPDLSVFLFNKLFGWLYRETKYVRTIHNTLLWDQWGRIGRYVEPFFICHHSNIAISFSVRDSYYEKYGERPPVVYNGLMEVKQQPFMDVDHSKTNILFAGRLEYQKGVDELVEIIMRCQDHQDLVFWIVGSGSLLGKIKEMMAETDNARYYEKIYHLSSYVGSFDYLLMPSNFEGLGLMSIEASLAKVPVIINSCPGLNETLPADWLLKVQNNNVEQYLEILSQLNRYDHEALGMKAYKYVKENFSIEKMQKDYEDFYYTSFLSALSYM